MKKLPKRYSGLLMGICMGASMGLMMSMIITWQQTGLDADFVRRWLAAFATTLPVGLAVSVVITPAIRHLVDELTDDHSAPEQ